MVTIVRPSAWNNRPKYSYVSAKLLHRVENGSDENENTDTFWLTIWKWSKEGKEGVFKLLLFVWAREEGRMEACYTWLVFILKVTSGSTRHFHYFILYQGNPYLIWMDKKESCSLVYRQVVNRIWKCDFFTKFLITAYLNKNKESIFTFCNYSVQLRWYLYTGSHNFINTPQADNLKIKFHMKYILVPLKHLLVLFYIVYY